MKNNYITVITYLLLSLSGWSISFAQTDGLEFLQCSSEPISLCVQDEGVRLPPNNQFYLGEGHPDATSCSVHVTQKKRVHSDCGTTLQYEVQLFINDTSVAYILKPLTTITTDSMGEAELFFNSEESHDDKIHLSGIPYTTGCHPYHRIKWIVTDSCGTEVICEQRMDLYDCQAPMVNHDSIELFSVQIPIGGQITVYAENFISDVLDDCTAKEDLLFSLKEHEYVPDMVATCDNTPILGVEVPFQIWVADQGRDLDCNGIVEWMERNIKKVEILVVWTDAIGCDPSLDHYIIGHIRNSSKLGIKHVVVKFNDPGVFHPAFTTSDNGMYKFQFFITGHEKSIVPERNDNHKNGVTTLDLVKIQKHLLGKEIFTSPYQFIASDANYSQTVSAIDLVELRKLILGIYSELPLSPSWRFVPESITFTDTMDLDSTNFLGIKIGDVNGSALPNFTQLTPRQSYPAIEFKTDQQSYQAGDIINIPIRISSDQSLSGFQFTMVYSGMEIIKMLPGRIDITEEHFALFGDKFTMSWFDINTIDVSNEDVLFTIQARATEPGNLSRSLSINSDITTAELYMANDETFLPILMVKDQDADYQLQIISCVPNPWKEETTVNFYLPESDQVTFTLFDATGREILITKKILAAGYHQHQIKSFDFPGRGLIFFQIQTSNQTSSIRMLVID